MPRQRQREPRRRHALVADDVHAAVGSDAVGEVGAYAVEHVAGAVFFDEAAAVAEGDDDDREDGERPRRAARVRLRWLPRLSAAAVRGTALLLSRLLRAARGPEQLLMSDVVGTVADTRMRLAGATGASW